MITIASAKTKTNIKLFRALSKCNLEGLSVVVSLLSMAEKISNRKFQRIFVMLVVV